MLRHPEENYQPQQIRDALWNRTRKSLKHLVLRGHSDAPRDAENALIDPLCQFLVLESLDTDLKFLIDEQPQISLSFTYTEPTLW